MYKLIPSVGTDSFVAPWLTEQARLLEKRETALATKHAGPLLQQLSDNIQRGGDFHTGKDIGKALKLWAQATSCTTVTQVEELMGTSVRPFHAILPWDELKQVLVALPTELDKS